MKAFKGTNNLRCLDITYEVGKTYEIEGDVIMCSSGFHFCRELRPINWFYKFECKKTVILEIEVNENDIVEEKDNRCVAKKIKINRILPKQEYNEHLKTIKYDYDKNENLIKYEIKHFSGGSYWRKWEYDKNNNKVNYEDSKGFWKKYKYDKNNNKVKDEDSKGNLEKYKYNENGNKIKTINTEGNGEIWTYDGNLLIKYEKISIKGNKTIMEYEYDSKDNKIKEIDENYYRTYEHDESNQMVKSVLHRRKDNAVIYTEIWIYDEYGNETKYELVREINPYQITWKNRYNDQGILIERISNCNWLLGLMEIIQYYDNENKKSVEQNGRIRIFDENGSVIEKQEGTGKHYKIIITGERT